MHGTHAALGHHLGGPGAAGAALARLPHGAEVAAAQLRAQLVAVQEGGGRRQAAVGHRLQAQSVSPPRRRRAAAVRRAALGAARRRGARRAPHTADGRAGRDDGETVGRDDRRAVKDDGDGRERRRRWPGEAQRLAGRDEETTEQRGVKMQLTATGC